MVTTIDLTEIMVDMETKAEVVTFANGDNCIRITFDAYDAPAFGRIYLTRGQLQALRHALDEVAQN